MQNPMPHSALSPTAGPAWRLEPRAQGYCLHVEGTWHALSGQCPVLPAGALASAHGALLIDTTHLGQWDSGLIAFLWAVAQQAQAAGVAFDLDGLPPAARRLLDLLPRAEPAPPPDAPRRKPGFVTRTGERTLAFTEETGAMTALALETGHGAFASLRGRGRMRGIDLMADVRAAGQQALVIVSVVNFLIGAILAFVGAVQLRKFAADIYVANLVGLASVREMSAVMTAIIMAGRTGGAYAARIATMQGNEEIDALEVFGISVSGYLLLPAILSLMLMMPLLYLYGCAVAMTGGFLVTASMLNVTALGYWHQTFASVPAHQFVFGFLKTVTFAALIGVTSCRIGLRAGRRAADVGTAATKAVVVGIVGVIALDAVFAVLANVVGF